MYFQEQLRAKTQRLAKTSCQQRLIFLRTISTNSQQRILDQSKTMKPMTFAKKVPQPLTKASTLEDKTMIQAPKRNQSRVVKISQEGAEQISELMANQG